MIESRDLEALIDSVSEVMNAHIATVVATLRTEIKETVQRHIQALPQGPPGKDAAPVDVEAIAERAASLIKAPKDGKDAEPVDIDSIVLRAAELIQKPADGRDGKNGVDGNDGKDGRDGKDGEPGLVGPMGQQGPQGERGESVAGPKGDTGDQGVVGPAGPQGERGVAGESIQGPIGVQGPQGERGADGRSVELADVEGFAEKVIQNQFSRWELELERRAQEVFQRAIDRMPLPKDGKDGLGFDDLNVAGDGDGLVTFSFKRGELEKNFPVRIPRQRPKGVYRDGVPYREGDHVVFGNETWAALQDAPVGKPGSPDSGWLLAVRKGKDGRDGVMKEAKPPETVKLK